MTVQPSLGLDIPAGAPRVLPVVMCTWARPHRLEETLGLLALQVGVAFELHIWNNNAAITSEVNKIVSKVDSFPIHVHHSDVNVGGFGRFFKARELAAAGFDRVVFIDDDVTFEPDMLATFDVEFHSTALRSFWTFRFHDRNDYWNRARFDIGREESADYCGTGGMIAPTAVFTNDELFECPERFWFIEDLWLSYFASHVLHMDLLRSANDIVIHKDEFDQALGILPQKTMMLRELCNDFNWKLQDERAEHGDDQQEFATA